jgi:hypothetical protein
MPIAFLDPEPAQASGLTRDAAPGRSLSPDPGELAWLAWRHWPWLFFLGDVE